MPLNPEQTQTVSGPGPQLVQGISVTALRAGVAMQALLHEHHGQPRPTLDELARLVVADSLRAQGVETPQAADIDVTAYLRRNNQL